MTSKLLGSFTIWRKKVEKILGHSIYKTQILDVHAQITIDGHKEFLFFQSLAYTTDSNEVNVGVWAILRQRLVSLF